MWAASILATVGEQLGATVDRKLLRDILLWKAIDNQREALVRAYAPKIGEVLSSIGDAVARTYISSQDPNKVAAEIDRLLVRDLKPLVLSMYIETETIFGSDTVRNVVPGLKGQKAPQLYNPLEDPIIATWNADRLGTMITGVSDATKRRVRIAIIEAFAEGRSVPEIAEIIQGIYPFSWKRAVMIARTEIIACSNAANHFAIGRHINTQGLYKTWLATMDRRTRHSHQVAHGQSQQYSRPFSVGGSALMFPGDGSLGASGKETIRCRCTTVYGRTRGL